MDQEIIHYDPISDARLDTQSLHFADHAYIDQDLINYGHEDQDPFVEEALGDINIPKYEEGHSTIAAPPPSVPSEDEPDPFLVSHTTQSMANLQQIPDHLLVIYAMVSWLHLQFSLPRVACNALLVILSCLLVSLDLTIITPFITLQSATHTLGLD